MSPPSTPYVSPAERIPARDTDVEFSRFDRGTQLFGHLSQMGITINGRRVIDLGTGFGFLPIAAAKAGAASVTAVDANQARLDAVAQRATDSGLAVTTVEANLLDGGAALPRSDLAFLIGVVEYAGLWDLGRAPSELQVRVFRTAYETLVPGGTLVFGSKNRLWPSQTVRDIHTRLPLVNALPRAWADRLSQTIAGKPYRHHIHSPRAWEKLLRAAGFTDIELFIPYYSYQLPVLIQRRGTFDAIARIRGMQLSDEERAAAIGPRWLPKAVLMGVGGSIGVPLAHSVLFKAVKSE